MLQLSGFYGVFCHPATHGRLANTPPKSVSRDGLLVVGIPQ